MAGSATAKTQTEAPLVPAVAGAAARAGACSLRAEAPIVGNIVCDGPWEILCSIEGSCANVKGFIPAAEAAP
jgi:hypothetical protein